ncbi:hypothetical protein BCR44DRAFT_1424054 [Catenaria anguillulae PL171]|uniref:P-loop containing nucleoside triphosphate hydrolase protein n=1 Tax=Catenaria anguillulae PL171 TaxID=765915 RepID=A0A1Y2I3X6_9FUNG|nr:hypothetical protein BCR44DRAFT_1424054 [Catenaria anguillulae PL171]
MKLNIKLVAVGGASCAGKSTLADRLQTALALTSAASSSSSSAHGQVHVFVLKQDTFFKPTDLIPVDPATGEANWEVPGALDFDAMARTFQLIRSAQSLDQLNALWKDKALGQDAQDHMRTSTAADAADQVPEWCPPASQLESLLARIRNEGQQAHRQVIVLVDGFLLFHDPLILSLFDARMFLAADFTTCHKRRYARTGYACADGVFWTDPPGYFEQFVWPAYLEFNKSVLQSLPPAFSTATLTDNQRARDQDWGEKEQAAAIAWRIEAAFECGSKAEYLCIDSREAVAGQQALFREALVKVIEHVLTDG